MVTPLLECRGLQLAYDRTTVLDGVDLAVRQGESVVLLGPSGSGKTSLLYLAAGFLVPTGGEILLDGAVVSTQRRQLAPERRGIGMVFQHYALWPHLSALDTVAYPLRRAGRPRAEARQRALELLELLGIAALAERRPSQLSGGEQQRVGVARALARQARLLLLDEPTAHLDAPLRAALVMELAQQQRRSGAAAVWATHDVTEALAVADRVAVLRSGRLVQVGTPQELHERPVDLWTARLSGSASVLRLDVLEAGNGRGKVSIDGQALELALDGAGVMAPGRANVLVRTDWAELGGGLEASVVGTWYRGHYTDYALATSAGELALRAPGSPRAGVGERVAWRLTRGWLPSDAVPVDHASGS